MKHPIGARCEEALDIAVISGAFATIPLTLLLERGAQGLWIETADWVIWSVFLIELLVRSVWSRMGYKHSLLLAAIVVLSFPLLPSALGLVRVIRLSRFLRLVRVVGVTVRGLEGLRTVLGRRSVVYVSAISVLVILAGAGGIALLEPQTVHGGFEDGVWWAIVTATTVGYGDISPTTFLGRSIAVVLMLTGVGLISTLSASITTHLLGQQESADLAATKAQLDRLEHLLSAIEANQAAEARRQPAVREGRTDLSARDEAGVHLSS